MARVTKDANGEQLAITIGGHVLPVVVSSEGEFYAEWEASTYHSTTFKGLRAKLLPLVRDDLKRCEIPVLLLDYHLRPMWREITLIGLHAGNGNALYLDESGKTEQVNYGAVYPRLTDAAIAEHARLFEGAKAAEEALAAWLKDRELKPKALVRKKLGLPAEVKEKNRWSRHGDDDD